MFNLYLLKFILKKNKHFIMIIEIFGSSISQSDYNGIIYNNYKNNCYWISFFDFDEYLEMFSESNKSIKIQEFLSEKKFKKCEVINIHWLIYPDNNLILYDNRTLIERFPFPNYKNKVNRFIKSIVRGKLNKIPFYPSTSSHNPEQNLIHCNTNGKIIKMYTKHSIITPYLKYAYLKHFNTKTVEEYVRKIKKGFNRNKKLNPKERIQLFFSHNKFSKEKLNIFEKAFNLNLKNRIKYYKNLYND